MADKIDVKAKIDMEENSKYRVALELMDRITFMEKTPRSREYFLRLYRQCFDAVGTRTEMEIVVTSASGNEKTV